LYVGSLWLHGEINREPGQDSTNFTPYPRYQGSTGGNDPSFISEARTCQHSNGVEQPFPSHYQSVNKKPREAEQIMEWLSLSYGINAAIYVPLNHSY